jgi:flagellar hook assembly protein FlgD
LDFFYLLSLRLCYNCINQNIPYDLDYEGVRTYHQVQSVTVEQKDLIFTNEAYILHNNYPNPFNPVTIIEFDVSEIVEGGAQINLSVYNLLGQKVITLLNGNYKSGNYKIQWNGKDAYSRDVPSGIYFYQITSSNHNYKIIKKMSLLR